MHAVARECAIAMIFAISGHCILVYNCFSHDFDITPKNMEFDLLELRKFGPPYSLDHCR